MNKLHREVGGKLRRKIKPNMAPEMVYRKLTIPRGVSIEGVADKPEVFGDSGDLHHHGKSLKSPCYGNIVRSPYQSNTLKSLHYGNFVRLPHCATILKSRVAIKANTVVQTKHSNNAESSTAQHKITFTNIDDSKVPAIKSEQDSSPLEVVDEKQVTNEIAATRSDVYIKKCSAARRHKVILHVKIVSILHRNFNICLVVGLILSYFIFQLFFIPLYS